MKQIKKIAIFSAVLFLLIVGGLLAGAHFFKDEIVARVLSQVNEKVDVPIAVAHVDFSLIHDFPNASVLFEEVFIADCFDETDTLLQSDLLALEFDIWDMVKGVYTIDKISLGQGRLKMRTLEDGQVNYIFWKQSEENDPTMTFAIDGLELSDTYFTYVDDQADLHISSDIGKAEMKGLFADGWMGMHVKLEGSNTALDIEGLQYLDGNDIAFESNMKIHESGHDIQFEECVAEVGKVKTPLMGRIYKQDEWALDLTLDGSLEIAEFLQELPADQKGNLDRYNPQGKVDFLLSIKGESSEALHPIVDLAFDLRAGELHAKDGSSVIRKIKSKGRYVRNEKGIDKIQFAHFDGKVPQGQISYSGLVSDFDYPYVIGDFSCDAEFADLLALSQQDLMTHVSGSVKVDLKVKGHLPTRNFDIKAKNRLTLSGEAILDDLGFEITSNGYSCSGIDTKLILENDRLNFDELIVTINEDPVVVNGYIDGLWPFILGDGKIELMADVRAENIHWDRWAQAAKTESGQSCALNKSIAIQTDFKIGTFTYSAFKAEQVSGEFEMKSGIITVDQLHLNSCNGSLDAQLEIAQLKDLHWAITCDAAIIGVNIDQLFREFDQFGQEFLTDNHLKGKADARIHFEGRFDPEMNAYLKSLSADADFLIVNGELKQHPAMQEIVNVLRDRNMLKSFVRTDELEEQLSHLRFNTLQNKIRIENEVIYIPEMKIANNAMDISIAGRHNFSNQVDYSLAFDLRDILVNKNNPEFYVEDDGLGHMIPLRMYGNVEDPVIELDKDKTRENRREAIAEAKADIREFFSDPFGQSNDDVDKDGRSAVKVQLEQVKSNKVIASPEKSEKTNATKKKRWKVLDKDDKVEEVVDEDDF